MMSRGCVSGMNTIRVVPNPALLISSTDGAWPCSALNTLSKYLSSARRESKSELIEMDATVVLKEIRGNYRGVHGPGGKRMAWTNETVAGWRGQSRPWLPFTNDGDSQGEGEGCACHGGCV